MSKQTNFICAFDLYQLPTGLVDTNKIDQFHDMRKKVIRATDKSEEQAGKPYLRVEIDATRSGSIVNGRVYTALSVRRGVTTWTSPHPKPILKHHRRSDSAGFFGGGSAAEDPIGRIHSAKFRPLVSSADLRRDFVDAPNRPEGSGLILLTAHVQDEEAIEKIIDGRLLTVSTGQHTTAARCSICGHDLANSGWCEHDPGKSYEIEAGSPAFPYIGKKDAKKNPQFPCFLVWDGKITYDECSFVNLPGQQFAAVTGFEMHSTDSGLLIISPPAVVSENRIRSVSFADSLVGLDVMADDLVEAITSKMYSLPPSQTTMKNDDGNSVETDDSTDQATEDEAPQPHEDVNSEPSSKDKPEEDSTMGDNDNANSAMDHLTEQLNAAKDEVSSLKAKIEAQDEKLKAAEDARVEANTKLSSVLAGQLYNMRMITGEYLDLDEDAKTAEQEKLAGRSIDSLQDAIDDLKNEFETAIKEAHDNANAEDEETSPAGDAAGSVKDPTLGDESKDEKAEGRAPANSADDLLNF